MLYRQRNQKYVPKPFNYIIIDTDGGGDDIQALIALDYYVKKQNKTLLGITCCNGNTTVSEVTKNVLIAQAICGSSYPVFVGNDFSLAGENLKDNFFGKDGIGEVQEEYYKKLKFDESLIQKQKPYRFIADSIIAHKNDISIICIGPLTNLALAYHYNNQIAKNVSNLSIMGTSDTLTGLSTFYTAEFNIALDPEAAYCIFQRFKDILLISLDTSGASIPEDKMLHLFTSTKSQKSTLIADIYKFQFKKAIPIPPIILDALAVVSLLNPSSIENALPVNMKIHIKGFRTRGASIIDYFSGESQNYNAHLVKDFNADLVIKEIQKSYDWE